MVGLRETGNNPRRQESECRERLDGKTYRKRRVPEQKLVGCLGSAAGAAVLARSRATGAVRHGQTESVSMPPVNIIGASPLLGSGVDRDTVPAETNVLKGNDLTRGGTLIAPDVTRALNEQVGGVNLNSASGNPYQPTMFYHGFEASALQGTPQGLAVYVNGVRFNSAFGDTVNFDLIPIWRSTR